MRTEERGCDWSIEENGRLGALQLIFLSKNSQSTRIVYVQSRGIQEHCYKISVVYGRIVLVKIL